ncbi:MAG: TMEM165/GDT1 family protein [Chloroflexi bacterium]|nr:TMEM165/GDT1 family protein [Chloroflexota bacterium]
MSPFWQSFFFIAAAELGDKSQLLSLAFAARFSARTVLTGIGVATLLVQLLSVTLGELVGLALPQFWVAIGAGLAFLGFGLWTLREDTQEDEAIKPRLRLGPFLTVVTAFALAELGDKTMLATVALASQHRAFVPVWLGSALGMAAANGLAILVGSLAGHRLPERAIRYGVVALFILTGLLTIGRAFL